MVELYVGISEIEVTVSAHSAASINGSSRRASQLHT
jgi:hypothetical protein